jgi:hypothetical protein
MALLHGTLAALDVARQAVLLELDTVVGEVAGDRRVVVAGGGQQSDKHDDGQSQTDNHEVGFLES